MLEDTLRVISDNVKLFIPPRDRVAGWRRSGNVVLLKKDKELCIIDSGGPSVRSQLVSIVDKA
ncbi:MAG: hypothetical protein ACFFCP_15290, partial [Promethearchaeota archaeon]